MLTYLHGQNPGSRVKAVPTGTDLRGLRGLVMPPLIIHCILLRFGDKAEESICVAYAPLCSCRLSKGADTI